MLRSWLGVAAIGILMLLLCVLSIALMSPPESTRLTIQGQHQLMTAPPHNNVIAQGQALGNELAPEIIAAFDNDPNIQETDFFDGGHPDAAGNQIVAERVYRKLQDLRWLSRPAP